jgi:LPXTG-motif cell wall-anchored protein
MKCIPGTNTGQAEISLPNDEPANDPSVVMDMTPTLAGQVFTPAMQTVPGQQSGKFTTVLKNGYPGGDGTIGLKWHDGHAGTDTRSFHVPPVKDCLPPPIPMKITVQVECKAVGGPNGASKFYLTGSHDPENIEVTFDPPINTKDALPTGGAPVTVKTTWTDPNYGPKSQVIETEPVAMCTVTPPPPDTTPKTPQPAVNQATASWVCNGGEYYLKTKLVSGDSNVTFSPEDGAKLTKGQHLSVTAAWYYPGGASNIHPINVDVPTTPCAVAMPTTGSSTAVNALIGSGAAVLGLIILWVLKRTKKDDELDPIAA